MNKTLENNWGFGSTTLASTHYDKNMMALMGLGGYFEGVGFTRDQMKHLGRFYETLSKEGWEEQRQQTLDNIRSEEPPKKEDHRYNYDGVLKLWKSRQKDAEATAEGIANLVERGIERDVFRQISRDGLRVMGVLARFLEKGEDPVHLVVNLMVEAGFDVDPCIISEVYGEEDGQEIA